MEEKKWEFFKNEYYNNYFKNIPLFAIIDQTKVAFISFIKNNEKSLTIGINVNPEYRGKKLSTPIILKSIEYIKNNYPTAEQIIAEIKEENIPSIKTFQNSNFILEGSFEKIINDKPIHIKKYIYKIKSQDNAVP